MSLWFLLHGLLPPLLFVVVRWTTKNLKIAIICACVAGLLEALVWFVLQGEVEFLSLITAAMIGGMGWLALRWDDPFYFKLQPAIFALAFAGFIVLYQVGVWNFDETLQSVQSQLAPSSVGEIFHRPGFQELFRYLIGANVLSLCLYAGLVVFVARRGSDHLWLLIRTFALYPITFAVSIGAVMFYPVVMDRPLPGTAQPSTLGP